MVCGLYFNKAHNRYTNKLGGKGGEREEEREMRGGGGRSQTVLIPSA